MAHNYFKNGTQLPPSSATTIIPRQKKMILVWLMTLTMLKWQYTFLKNIEKKKCVRLTTVSLLATMQHKKHTQKSQHPITDPKCSKQSTFNANNKSNPLAKRLHSHLCQFQDGPTSGFIQIYLVQ